MRCYKIQGVLDELVKRLTTEALQFIVYELGPESDNWPWSEIERKWQEKNGDKSMFTSGYVPEQNGQQFIKEV